MNSNTLYINRVTTFPKINNFDVTLKKGLNIILAQDIGGQGTVNSVGKSTFVNLINYGLASNTFIHSEIAKERMHNHFLLMEFSIGSEKITIKRNIFDGDTCELFDGWVIEGITNGHIYPSKKSDLEAYKTILEDLLFKNKNYFEDSKIINLRGFIYLLFRVQGSGFEKIDQPLANYEKAKIKRRRLQFISGLLTDEINKLNQDVQILEEEEKERRVEYQVIKKYVNQRIHEFEFELEVTNTELEKGILKLKSEIDSKKEELGNTQSNQQKLTIKIQSINKELKLIEKEIEIYISRIKNYYATLNEIDIEKRSINFLDKTKKWIQGFEYKKCPMCLKSFDYHEETDCPSFEDNKSYRFLLKLLENEQEELIEGIRIYTEEKEMLEISRDIDNSILKGLYLQQDEDVEYLLKEIKELEDELKSMYEKEFKTKNLLKSLDDIEKYEIKWTIKKDELVNKRSKVRLEEKQQEKSLSSLKTHYNEVIQFLYNNTKKGLFELTKVASNFKVTVVNNDEHQSEDKGDATNIIKVIGFDLALLKLSTQSNIIHPKFLVHDSPNVRDIDPEVYKRIMSYAIKMEKEHLDFQYIITTLTIPDKIKPDSNYIRCILHNDGDGGKLFGFTF